MLKNIPTKEILEVALSGGADFAELFTEHTVSTSVSHEDRRLERVSSGIDAGYGVRAVFGKKTMYGFTNDPSKLLEVAASIGKSNNKPDIKHSTKRSQAGPVGINEKNLIANVTTAAKISWGFGTMIRQVQVNARHTVRHTWIVNSNGLNVENEKNDSILVVLVVSEKDGILQTGYEPGYGPDISPEELAKTASSRALLMLGAVPSPRGIMPVVISSSAGGTVIHEAVGHGLEADLACANMSVYSGKIGEKVASDLVTVVDDSTLPERRGTFSFDDEGNPAQKTILIENGILKTYMYNDLTAKVHGKSPTSNGRRESYRNRPLVRMTNTFVTPGKNDPDAIVRSVPNGIFVKKMGGGQVNTINGDFVFEAQEAYLIKGGRIGSPVRGVTLIGNGPKVLMQIDMVGTDLGFGVGTCGKEGQGVPVGHGMPTIRIPEITIGGTS